VSTDGGKTQPGAAIRARPFDTERLFVNRTLGTTLVCADDVIVEVRGQCWWWILTRMVCGVRRAALLCARRRRRLLPADFYMHSNRSRWSATGSASRIFCGRVSSSIALRIGMNSADSHTQANVLVVEQPRVDQGPTNMLST
jgi:hypothetical protein